MAGSPNRSAPARHINSVKTQTPSFNDVGFDPYGAGEKLTAIKNPLAATFAYEASKAAVASTAKKYPGVFPQNNEADAYRHALWSHLMAKGIGPDLAKAFGDAHEISGSGISDPGPKSERLMDLYNNQVGRELPHDRGEAFNEALEKGYLRKRPFRE